MGTCPATNLPTYTNHSFTRRIRRGLATGKPVKGPDIAWFVNLLEKDRAQTYIAYNDYLPFLIHHPEEATVGAPSDWIATQIGKMDWEETCADLRAGAPSDWRTPSYGSPAFMNQMMVEQKAGNTRFKYPNGPVPPG